MPGHIMPKSHQGILYTRYSSPPQKPIDRPTKPGQRPIFIFSLLSSVVSIRFFFQGAQKKNTVGVSSNCVLKNKNRR